MNMSKSFSMDDYLNLYPPKKKVLHEKKQGQPKAAPQSGLGHKSLEKMEASKELDIHGSSVEEAQEEMKKFIQDCWRTKVRRALIIHGKGKHSPKGAVLKPMVQELLKNHPLVAVFGEARKNEGGPGATWFSPIISREK